MCGMLSVRVITVKHIQYGVQVNHFYDYHVSTMYAEFSAPPSSEVLL